MIVQLPQDHDQVAVYVRLPAAIWADTIHLVGDFNDWSTHATPMRLGEQYWEARLLLPAGQRYGYAFLLDGSEWCADTPARECALGGGPPLVMLPLDIPQARRQATAAEDHIRSAAVAA